MLNNNPIAKDAGGRLKNIPSSLIPTPHFNGGTALSDLGEIITSTLAPARRNGGLGYDNAGPLCIDTAGAIAGYVQGGLPVTAAGRLAVSVNLAVTKWNAGIPFDAGGRVALATASGFLNLHAFTNAFSQAAFN
jgi:hypothetical protein